MKIKKRDQLDIESERISMTMKFLDKSYDSIILGSGNVLENEEFKHTTKTPTQEVIYCLR